MFTAKKNRLFGTPKAQTSGVATATKKKTTNKFVAAAAQNSARTLSGNGALKYSTTGNPFVDQFGKLGTYKAPRSYADIAKDCEILWAENPLLTVCFLFYVRMITRVVSLFNGLSTKLSQKGGEMRHEGIMRMIWLSQKAPSTFIKNIGLFISVGSWKDIFTMLQYDLVYNGWEGRVLDWKALGGLILSGLENDKTSNLVKKYLPQIKANSACKTVEAQADNMIAKWICSLLFGNKQTAAEYKKYRLMKTSGTAHEWQKLISQHKFDRINFDTIHGRALKLLSRSKFLKNAGLEAKYAKWIGSDEAKVKYTGFVHELFEKLPGSLTGLPANERDTINKQFDVLVTKAKDVPSETKFIVVRDTSSSMNAEAQGTKMSSNHIAKALALYFAEFLEGAFKDHFIEFNTDAKMHTWKGKTPLEKWYNDTCGYIGSTNFQSVIDLFIRLKRQGIAESEFPTGILCISDGEFNPAALGKTNVDAARAKLEAAGFSKKFCKNFVICLWNIPNRYYSGDQKVKFETYGDVPNVFYLSGYSGSVVSFLLTGKATNADELFQEAMDQEILNMIEL
jgi:hypothetical protein